MLIPKSELWRVCSPDKFRVGLSNVHFNKAKTRLEASDGKMLAVVPLDPESCEGDTGEYITQDALKAAVKDRFNFNVEVNGEIKMQDGRVFPAPQGVPKFPDIDAVIPKPEEADAIISLDAGLLYNLAKAIIGKERDTLMVELHVRLQKTTKNRGGNTASCTERGMNVIPHYPVSEGAQGVLMPCRLIKS